MKKKHFNIYDNQVSGARNKIDTFPIKQFTTSRKRPTETLIRNLNLYCKKKTIFKFKKINAKRSFWHYVAFKIIEEYKAAYPAA